VARSFGLNDAPTLLAKSEIVSKQKQKDLIAQAREKEMKKTNHDNDDDDDDIPSTTATRSSKPILISSRKRPLSDSKSGDGGEEEGITSGIRPLFGHRDRARNVAATANDAAYHQRERIRLLQKKQNKPENPKQSIGWKIGKEVHSQGVKSKLARTSIDRVRSLKM
jgi:hypothetical protein